MRLRPSARRARAALACVALLAFAAACGDDEPDTLPFCADVRPLTVRVSDEPVPRVTWTPACRASVLLVRPPGQAEPGFTDAAWWIYTPTGSEAWITPGVRLGQLPQGTVEGRAWQGLVDGTTYNVEVGQQLGGPDALLIDIYGSRAFTR